MFGHMFAKMGKKRSENEAKVTLHIKEGPRMKVQSSVFGAQVIGALKAKYTRKSNQFK